MSDKARKTMPRLVPSDRPEPAAKPCPICSKPSTALSHPFCSKRCADIDLNRWLGGVYAVPVAQDDQDDSIEDEGTGQET